MRVAGLIIEEGLAYTRTQTEAVPFVVELRDGGPGVTVRH
jgi:hypothetical protein